METCVLKSLQNRPVSLFWYRALRSTHEHCHSLFVIRSGYELQQCNCPSFYLRVYIGAQLANNAITQ